MISRTQIVLGLGLLAVAIVPAPAAAERAPRTASLRGETAEELALSLNAEAGQVQGELRTALGNLAFRSYVAGADLVRVEYDLGPDRGTLALLVDRAQRTAEPSYPEGFEITQADRYLFRSLSLALSRAALNEGPETEALLRSANLWGAHPIAPLRLERIQAPREKGWTNLCGITSATLYHDATSHGLIGERLATGPNASSCRSRCGAGCDALIGTSAWTVDCGEHDRCEQAHSCCVSCQDEFNSASDDFLFAPNCRLTGW